MSFAARIFWSSSQIIFWLFDLMSSKSHFSGRTMCVLCFVRVWGKRIIIADKTTICNLFIHKIFPSYFFLNLIAFRKPYLFAVVNSAQYRSANDASKSALHTWCIYSWTFLNECSSCRISNEGVCDSIDHVVLWDTRLNWKGSACGGIKEATKTIKNMKINNYIWWNSLSEQWPIPFLSVHPCKLFPVCQSFPACL